MPQVKIIRLPATTSAVAIDFQPVTPNIVIKGLSEFPLDDLEIIETILFNLATLQAV